MCELIECIELYTLYVLYIVYRFVPGLKDDEWKKFGLSATKQGVLTMIYVTITTKGNCMFSRAYRMLTNIPLE